MITTTRSHTNTSGGSARTRRGFTLVEVMIGATLSSFILAGVLTAFLFMGRSGANIRNYNDMETQARKALEVFAEDVRQASAVTWNSSQSITLTVNSAPITYAYSSGTAIFSRNTGTGAKTLISGVTANSFAFKGYTITETEITALTSAADLLVASNSTKQLQISLAVSRKDNTVTAATNIVLSARFILRNKVVTA